MHSEFYIYVAIDKIKRDNVPRIHSKFLFHANSQIIQHRTEGKG